MTILRSPRVALPLSAVFLGTTLALASMHLDAIRAVQGSALPAAAQLATLQRRADILEEQVTLTEMQAKTRTGSAQEKLHAYVLPSDEKLARLLAAFEVMEGELRRKEMVSDMTGMNVGDWEDSEETEETEEVGGVGEVGEVREVREVREGGRREDLAVRPLAVTYTVTREGAEEILLFVELSGLLTVGDALSPGQLQSLFDLTEAHNPAGIVALEKFLSGDLLSYARAPRKAEQVLLQAFPSDRFLEQLREVLADSRLPDAQAMLGGEMGTALMEQKLWPVQMLLPTHVALTESEGGMYELSLRLAVYGREEGGA